MISISPVNCSFSIEPMPKMLKRNVFICTFLTIHKYIQNMLDLTVSSKIISFLEIICKIKVLLGD